MLETGFVGLCIIISILLKPAWRALRDYRMLPAPDRYLSLMLLVNLLVFYFQMYSVGMYSWGQNGYVLWILIAITFRDGLFDVKGVLEEFIKVFRNSRRTQIYTISICVKLLLLTRNSFVR